MGAILWEMLSSDVVQFQFVEVASSSPMFESQSDNVAVRRQEPRLGKEVGKTAPGKTGCVLWVICRKDKDELNLG